MNRHWLPQVGIEGSGLCNYLRCNKVLKKVMNSSINKVLKLIMCLSLGTAFLPIISCINDVADGTGGVDPYVHYSFETKVIMSDSNDEWCWLHPRAASMSAGGGQICNTSYAAMDIITFRLLSVSFVYGDHRWRTDLVKS